jgi:hypothetical protein
MRFTKVLAAFLKKYTGQYTLLDVWKSILSNTKQRILKIYKLNS